MSKVINKVRDFAEFTDILPKKWADIPRVNRDQLVSSEKTKRPFIIYEMFKKDFKSKIKGKKGRYDVMFVRLALKEAPKLSLYAGVTSETVIRQLEEHKKDLPFSCTYWHMKGGKYGKYDTLRGSNV